MLDLILHSIGMRKIQAFSVLLTVALSVVLILATSLVYLGVNDGVKLSSERGGSEYLVLPTDARDQLSESSILFTGAPVAVYFPIETYDKIASVKGVTACTPQFYSQTLAESCCTTGNETRVIGIDEASDFVVKPLIETPVEGGLADDQVYVGVNIAVSDASTLLIRNKEHRVASYLAETGSDLDNSIVMSIDAARALSKSLPGTHQYWDKYGDPENLVSCALLNIDDSEKEFAERKIQNFGGLRVIERSMVVEDSQNQLASVFQVLFAAAALMLVISVVQLFARYYSMAFDRKGELALYRAVGSTKRQMKMLVFGEAAILTSIGYVVGIALGFGAYQLLMSSLTQNSSFPFVSPGAGAVAAVALGILAVFAIVLLAATSMPLSKIGRIDPSMAMQQGDIDS